MKLHPEKIKFKLKTVPYVGRKLTSEGLQADESKVTAIKQFPAPTNVHEVRRFLGMVNFFSRFVPNLSAILEPLHGLTKKRLCLAVGSRSGECNEEGEASFVNGATVAVF